MTEFNNQNSIQEIILNNKVLIVLFYAKWCMPCKSISQSLLDLKNNYNNELEIITLNVDNFAMIALENNIKTVPTLQYYNNGLLYLKESGFRTKDHLMRNINALLVMNIQES